MPSGAGVEDSDYGEGQDDSRGYQMGPMENGTGVGMGVGMGTTAGGGVGYSSSSLAGIKEPGSSPGLQYYHHQQDHQSRHQYGYQQQNQQQYQQSPHEQLHQHLHQRHQQHQMEQQIHQAADFYPRQQHAQLLQEQYQQGQKQQEPGAPDKAIRSSTFSRPYARHHQQQQQQQQQQASRHHHHSPQSLRNWSQNSGSFQQPEDPSFLQQPFRASPYTEAQYLRESSQNDDGDDMDIDSGESNQASAVALCSSCIRREGLFRHNQCSSSSTAGPQDQFPTVRSLTFRGTAIVPEIIALFPNLETLAFEEMRSKTPTPTISLPSVPGDALIHGSTNSRVHGRMSSSQSHSEFGSSSFYTESGDDSLDATASLSLEAELPGPPSRQSVMISELAIMLKNHCPLLTRLVLNEPLLVEDLSREQLRLQNNSLSSTIGDQSPSLGSSHTYPVDNLQQCTGASRGQDQLALLLQVIPCLKQFVAHSRVVAKCPQLLDTLLEYHHPHLVSFQVLDDSQDMSHYPSIQNPNATPVMPHHPQHHAFYSTQDIYEQRSPHQQQQLYEQQGYQYLPTFVPCEESPAMQQQQQQQYDYSGVGGNGLPGSPSAQPSSLLHQALQTQHYLQQLQRQQTILRLQGSSFRILESCPNLQVFESKIPLPLQQLIGSVPRWACGSEITVLWLEIQELTGDSGLDPEEEEVMQMFVRSLFKGSRSNTASSSPPQEMTSSGGGEGDLSRLTTISPSPPPPPPPPPPPTGAATAPGIVCDGLSPCASVGDMVSATATSPGFRSYLVEVGSSGTDLSSLESVVPAAAAAAGGGGGSETFPSPSPPLDIWTSEGPHQQQPVLSAVNIVSPAAGTGTSPGWNKPLAPPPPPLAFTSPATISLTMGGGGGGASYTSKPCHIEGIERLVALQFLVEHQLVYLPKLDRFLVGNCVYTIPTRERVF
ncbi:hypothetical protein BGZ97_009669 [Linnemannia gamsii]|uniref:Uncharacterized protein n=1 Tax=Linnemannia gamsii TaxID=64522 RepID=A0A9P6UPQ5_9FUNG|nr:hypothetical protein BGZ97_009669 [Linnemannia gamsii]